MQSFGHGITFGRVCYISDVGPEMLDLITSSGLSITMTGDGLVATTHEALDEHVREETGHTHFHSKAKVCEEFLSKILGKINDANLQSAQDGHDPDSTFDEPEAIGEIIFSV